MLEMDVGSDSEGLGARISWGSARRHFEGENSMKRILRIGLILIGVLTIWVACSARERGQSLPRAPEPPVDLQSLTKALSGEWSLSVRFEADAAMPNGVVNAGEETWRAGPGGYTLMEEEHVRLPQGDAFLLGIIWWIRLKDAARNGMPKPAPLHV